MSRNISNTSRSLSSRVATFIAPVRQQLMSRTPVALSRNSGSKPYLSHEERTSDAPRHSGIHSVTLSSVEQVNRSVRLLRLQPHDTQAGVDFAPGQWLDVFVPDPAITKPGGFTITSTPAQALRHIAADGTSHNPFLELAIQDSPRNPPAAWLWRPVEQILGQTLLVRAGGSFVWPPPGADVPAKPRILLVAGGVGINPLISILSHLQTAQIPVRSIKLLYTTKSNTPSGSDILFLPRIMALLNHLPRTIEHLEVTLYTTSSTTQRSTINRIPGLSLRHRRIATEDLEEALGREDDAREDTICYVCGPRDMTDNFVDFLKEARSVKSSHVLCEKWW